MRKQRHERRLACHMTEAFTALVEVVGVPQVEVADLRPFDADDAEEVPGRHLEGARLARRHDDLAALGIADLEDCHGQQVGRSAGVHEHAVLHAKPLGPFGFERAHVGAVGQDRIILSQMETREQLLSLLLLLQRTITNK